VPIIAQPYGDSIRAQFFAQQPDDLRSVPAKYKFRYIVEIPPSIRSIELHLGDSVHRAFEKLHSDAMHGHTYSCDEIVTLYQKTWDEGYAPQMRIVRSGTTAQTYLEYGRQMLLTYHRRFHPFTQSTTLELEEKFLFPLSENHEIRGIIDRLAKAADGSLEIHDYKTSRRLPNPSQVASDTQLALYEMALRHRWPDTQRIALIWGSGLIVCCCWRLPDLALPCIR
jgi:putative RecB family exonuclease